MDLLAPIAAAKSLMVGVPMLAGFLAMPWVRSALDGAIACKAAGGRAAFQSLPAPEPGRRTPIRHAARDAAVRLLVAPLILAVPTPGWSKDKPTRFWNLTGETVTHLALAPAGTDAYGSDQCTNDRDGTVDFDERLPIVGVAPGRYDIRLDLKKGRRCRVRNIEVQAGEVFSVEAGDLTDCTP